MSEKAIKKAECSRCGGERNCHIVGYFKDMHSEGDDRYTYDWCDEWHILQCAGCDFVFAQTVSTNSEDYDQDYDHDGSTVTTYNETLSYWPAVSKRKRPEWLRAFINGYADDGRERLSKAMKELYGALDNDLHMLAGIGIRTCFDIASELLGVESTATFARKLDAIVDIAHIGKPDRSHLETLVEAGHASAHRGWTPTPEQLDTLMDILEYFVAEAFVRPEQQRERDAKVEKVKAHVPVRHVKKKPAKKVGK